MADIFITIAAVEWMALGLLVLWKLKKWNRKMEELYEDMKKQWEAEDLRQSAEKQIRNALAMQQFIHDYNITVSDEDIDARQAEILSHYNNPKMQENFKTPEARRHMHEQLLTDRAHAKLAELNEGK